MIEQNLGIQYNEKTNSWCYWWTLAKKFHIQQKKTDQSNHFLFLLLFFFALQGQQYFFKQVHKKCNICENICCWRGFSESNLKKNEKNEWLVFFPYKIISFQLNGITKMQFHTVFSIRKLYTYFILYITRRNI